MIFDRCCTAPIRAAGSADSADSAVGGLGYLHWEINFLVWRRLPRHGRDGYRGGMNGRLEAERFVREEERAKVQVPRALTLLYVGVDDSTCYYLDLRREDGLPLTAMSRMDRSLLRLLLTETLTRLDEVEGKP